MRARSLAVAVVASVAFAAPAQQRGLARAVLVAKGPPIDGTLRSPLWARCRPLVLGDCTSDRPGPLKTIARVLFSPSHLFVAFECEEPDTANLRAEVTRRDGPVWQDDCVEVFVSGDPRVGFFHFAVNPRATLLDAHRRPGAREDTTWNSSAAVKTSVEKGKRWVATLAVPLKELGAYLGDNQTWVANFNRTRPARGGRPAAEWSWAVMGSNDFHQSRYYGRLTGVSIRPGPSGVTRRAAPAPPPPGYEKGQRAGDVVVYRRYAHMRVPDDGSGTNKTIELLISGSGALKVAFLARGTGGVRTAQFNLYDELARDNTTSDAYRIVGPTWTPILYRADRFFYNDGMNRRVARATSYRNLRFHGNRTGGKGVLELRNFVIYRGEDHTPPAAPANPKATADREGVHLSWDPAGDNVGVALYVISRAGGHGHAVPLPGRHAGRGFQKIGESLEPRFTDKPPAPGTWRYRVLAADFQDNLGPWSETAGVRRARGFPPRPPTPEERDRVGYAERARAIHARGAGKVVKGRVLCFGDSITGATNYRRFVESALGRYDVWARGYPAMKTAFARKKIAEDLQAVNPEFCLIMYGTNNSKAPRAIPPAMDDLRAVAKACERRGTVPIIATIPPRGFKDPASEPEARFNAALIEMCRGEKIPIAYVFEAFLEYEKSGDRRTLLAPDGVHYITGGWKVTAAAWKAAMDQVLFAILDRP